MEHGREGSVFCGAPDCRLGWPWSSLDVHMLLLSAFIAIFGCFAVALKWLTEKSGRQWSWPEVHGGPTQTLGSSQLAGTCGIEPSGVAVIRAVYAV